jgi:hypothetical protein
MRNINIFRTTKRDHAIPRDIMIRALQQSPGKDWTDPKTDAYDYLKRWALQQDEKIDGPLDEKPTQESIRKALDGCIQRWQGHNIPIEIIREAMELSPGMSIDDKRTKAYKYLKSWTNGKTN